MTATKIFLVFVSACLVSLQAAAQLAVATIVELAEQASCIYLATVTEVVDPKWIDESGQRVMIAISPIERTLKGTDRKDLPIAFKPTVSDQAKFSVGGRYLIFVYGPQLPLVFANRTATLPIVGEDVETGQLRNEPRIQRLETVLSRINTAVKR
jgi:hypothetical protein